MAKTHDPDLKPYNKEEWQKIANDFLMQKDTPSTALWSAYIALRRDDPTLAEKCSTEALRRRKQHSQRHV